MGWWLLVWIVPAEADEMPEDVRARIRMCHRRETVQDTLFRPDPPDPVAARIRDAMPPWFRLRTDFDAEFVASVMRLP